MNAFRFLILLATAITRLPGLLRWIGGLFEKSLEERLAEVKEAEAKLKTATTPEDQDEALKKISINLHSSDR